MARIGRKTIIEKTADYTIPTIGGLAAIYTNRGATGTVTFTLPADAPTGWFCEVSVIADYTVAVATATTDTLIAFNDATADSVTWGTSGQKVGNGGKFTYDGTGWIMQYHPATGATTTTSTVTVATA